MELDELQRKIDSELKPHSFDIPGKKLKITEASKTGELEMNNVAAFVEGSDPVLKNEYVVFSAHIDHIGVSGEKVNQGADDDASGCASILDIAEAFRSLKKKPLRSVLFLWVSGEEIGLFGSQAYVNNPLFPLEKTVIDLNMDMIGRDKGPADTTANTPMSGPKGVFVITGNQSSDIMNIAAEVDRKSVIDFDYSLSGRNHPLQLFARSDHYNFVKKDIPVLFFTGGLHTDYHTPGDDIAKIDFDKMELVSRAAFEIGYTVANRKTRPVVDKPFSKW
jgi:Zn-dependent M28 family amino/carboxypeptidase